MGSLSGTFLSPSPDAHEHRMRVSYLHSLPVHLSVSDLQSYRLSCGQDGWRGYCTPRTGSIKALEPPRRTEGCHQGSSQGSRPTKGSWGKRGLPGGTEGTAILGEGGGGQGCRWLSPTFETAVRSLLDFQWDRGPDSLFPRVLISSQENLFKAGGGRKSSYHMLLLCFGRSFPIKTERKGGRGGAVKAVRDWEGNRTLLAESCLAYDAAAGCLGGCWRQGHRLVPELPGGWDRQSSELD